MKRGFLANFNFKKLNNTKFKKFKEGREDGNGANISDI